LRERLIDEHNRNAAAQQHDQIQADQGTQHSILPR
jgi:hypothetical protein